MPIITAVDEYNEDVTIQIAQARDINIQNIRERLERDNIEVYELENITDVMSKVANCSCSQRWSKMLYVWYTRNTSIRELKKVLIIWGDIIGSRKWRKKLIDLWRTAWNIYILFSA